MRSAKVTLIRSKGGEITFRGITHCEDNRSDTGTLVFAKYGDQYFLHEILCSLCGMNVALPGSKHEKLARTGWRLVS